MPKVNKEVVISFRADTSVKEWLQEKADREDQSLSKIVYKIVCEYIDKEKNK